MKLPNPLHRMFPLLAGTLLSAGAANAGRDAVIVYPAFGDVRGAVVEGRVVEKKSGSEPGAADGRLHNLTRNARMFRNEERDGRAVSLRLGEREWQVKTDEEGYFRADIPADAVLAPGWQSVTVNSAGAVNSGQLLVVPPENIRGLISDLDDTILVTEVTSKSRMLRNTFLRNPAQRTAVPGTARLYAKVMAANPRPEAAPLVYLSASPRQLHDSIAKFLALNSFPNGVLITKRVTNDKTSEPLANQFAYKTKKIEDIFARLPNVRFVLVGDDGERDPEIYDWVRKRYPDRVEAIWIRRVHPDPQRARPEGQRDLAELIEEPVSGVAR
jgi:phosphatidate phosphatase APP1